MFCVFSFLSIVYVGLVGNNQPRKIGSIADIDPLNGVYGSMDYKTYGQQSHSQQSQQQSISQQQQQPVRYTQQQAAQSALQQKPMAKSISSQVVNIIQYGDTFSCERFETLKNMNNLIY